MSLAPGSYRITSKETKTLVGRAMIEDFSLRPKRIMASATGINNGPWHIVPANVQAPDEYILRALGSPVVNIDGKVFADLVDDIKEKAWVIHPQFHQGKDLYTITSPDDAVLGWVVFSEEEKAPVEVKPLVATKSIPPHVFENGLFEIIRIDQEE